ncbi:hypothetical protein [Deinococcus ficus]|uniref:DUF11 domain-containing protein n=1 Tax=Deinococcus ficus TaxID=317577 RepID=A0A221T2V6_9DEIO|nr:hypothetical protein [Deinococcus ficus]ASN83238.1 hypothetical protein DFI_18750 [Deinococcus ficus]
MPSSTAALRGRLARLLVLAATVGTLTSTPISAQSGEDQANIAPTRIVQRLGTAPQYSYEPQRTAKRGQTVIQETAIRAERGTLRNFTVTVPVPPKTRFAGIETLPDGARVRYSTDGVKFSAVPKVRKSDGRVAAALPREYIALQVTLPELLAGDTAYVRLLITLF